MFSLLTANHIHGNATNLKKIHLAFSFVISNYHIPFYTFLFFMSISTYSILIQDIWSKNSNKWHFRGFCLIDQDLRLRCVVKKHWVGQKVHSGFSVRSYGIFYQEYRPLCESVLPAWGEIASAYQFPCKNSSTHTVLSKFLANLLDTCKTASLVRHPDK